MSKHRLLLDEGYEYLAFGVSCHLKDYRVAWYLNKSLNKDFIRRTVSLQVAGGKLEDFPLFSCQDSDAHLRFKLLANKNEELVLMKALRQYDYFLFVEGYLDIFHADEFVDQLQRIEPFQLITPMDSAVFDHLQFALFEE